MNGCYDIVHLGHLRSFNESRMYGDTLVVAINSDESIKKLKGPSRPINSQEDRKEFLENIIDVDHVFIFDSTDVCEILKKIKPNVWLKSGYTIETINKQEYATALQLGIEVVFLPISKDISTSAIVNKIRNE